jgi:hypothetical protein
VLGFLSVKLLPIQVAAAQIISHLAPSSISFSSFLLVILTHFVDESQFEITKAGGLRKIYKALRGEQMLQKEALKILTTFSKNGTLPRFLYSHFFVLLYILFQKRERNVF